MPVLAQNSPLSPTSEVATRSDNDLQYKKIYTCLTCPPDRRFPPDREHIFLFFINKKAKTVSNITRAEGLPRRMNR